MRLLCGYPMALVVLAIHFAIAVSSVREKSNTYDEIAHITAGYSYWTNNDYRLQPENGILPQRWLAVPLLSMGLQFPKDEAAWNISNVWEIGNKFFFDRDLGNDVESLLWRARCMNALVSIGLGLLVYAWSRWLFGPGGGLISLLLYVLNPTILANGSLATSDLMAAAFFTAAVGGVWSLFQKVSPGTMVCAWLALAGLFLSKMSAWLIVPMALAMLCVRLIRRRPLILVGRKVAAVNGRFAQAGVLFGVTIVQAFLVIAAIWAFYGFRYSAFHEPLAGNERFYLAWDDALANSGAFGKTITLARDHHLMPEAYLYGTAFVVQRAKERSAFLNGEYSETGWWYFFPYTFFVKTPLVMFPMLLLAGVAVVWRWRPTSGRISHCTEQATNSVPLLPGSSAGHDSLAGTACKQAVAHGKQAVAHVGEESGAAVSSRQPRRVGRAVWRAFYAAAPLWILLVVYWGSAIHAKLNIGHRHILPTYPAVFILAGASVYWFRPRRQLQGMAESSVPLLPGSSAEGSVQLPGSSAEFNQPVSTACEQAVAHGGGKCWLERLASAAVVICLFALAIDCYAAYPHYLAYFNPIAGGPSNGYKRLVDSSLDWGQDLPGLKQWLTQHELDGQDRMPVYLAYFGTASPAYYQIRATELGDTVSGSKVIPLTEGVYCVSATQLQSVYRFAPGPWTEQYETAYRDLNRLFQQVKIADPAARQKMIEARGTAFWAEMIAKFNGLRLSRLCGYLRSREPEDQVGYSILIYRLTDKDIHDALFAPSPEIEKDMGPVEELSRSTAAESQDLQTCNDRAWTLATSPDAAIRNGTEAVSLAQRAVELSGGGNPAVLDTLAAALAEAGRFAEAVQTAQKALELATSEKKATLADTLRARIELYKSGKPYHAMPKASTGAPPPSR